MRFIRFQAATLTLGVIFALLLATPLLQQAGYRRLKQKGFEHTATAICKQNEPAYELFPWVHITLSNLKRFLLGTHHKVEQKHLQHYVAEFNYRLNRRIMEPDLMIRLLRACICAQTITYKQLVAMPEIA